MTRIAMNIVIGSYLYVIPPVVLHQYACCMPKILPDMGG
jgi:hypothetical protein